jgi:hypothetical protein
MYGAELERPMRYRAAKHPNAIGTTANRASL